MPDISELVEDTLTSARSFMRATAEVRRAGILEVDVRSKHVAHGVWSLSVGRGEFGICVPRRLQGNDPVEDGLGNGPNRYVGATLVYPGCSVSDGTPVYGVEGEILIAGLTTNLFGSLVQTPGDKLPPESPDPTYTSTVELASLNDEYPWKVTTTNRQRHMGFELEDVIPEQFAALPAEDALFLANQLAVANYYLAKGAMVLKAAPATEPIGTTLPSG